LSLIADSLKKAVREKSADAGPGINLLKNLRPKAGQSRKLDPEGKKRGSLLSLIVDSLKKLRSKAGQSRKLHSKEVKKEPLLSQLADSFKKAGKEKSSDADPEVNILKSLSEAKAKSSSKFSPQEVQRFIILIVLPASILLYLLIGKPFDRNKKLQEEPPPVVAKAPAPPVQPIPQSAPKPSAPPPPTAKGPVKEPDNIQVIEPGMKKVPVQDDPVKKVVKPKPVAGPKKKSSVAETKAQEPVAKAKPFNSEKPVEPPAKDKPDKTETTKIIKPKSSERAPPSRAEERSFPTTPEPDIFKNSDYYFNRAIFYQQARNWEKALTNYSKAAELDAKNADIYNNIGVIYKELRQYDRAIDEFLRAIYLNPNYAKPYNNIGVVYYAKRNFSGAIRNYQKAIAIEPENLEALNNLAVAYKNTSQLEQSKSILNQALKIDAKHAGTNYNLAVIYEQEGNQKAAIRFYRRFVELGLNSHPGLVAQVSKHIETLK
jgi:Tfp pilus assembly protein PilF